MIPVRALHPIPLEIRLECLFADFERLVGLRRFPNLHRVVLALRMAFPVLWHQQAAQVRMAVENDAEHVPHFPLEPPRGRPHALHGGHGARVGHTHFEAQPQAVWHRQEVIDHLEARVPRQVVGGGHLDEHVEAERRGVAEHGADRHETIRRNVNRRRIDTRTGLVGGTGYERTERINDCLSIHPRAFR